MSGSLDGNFIPMDGERIHERVTTAHWWRITLNRPVAASTEPQLVLQSPGHNRVEAWLPGQHFPITRALIGGDADPAFSSRALVIPLAAGLRVGEPIYLRVYSPRATPMDLSIETLGMVHRADLIHVAWRSALLGGLALLAILALGFWIGMGERSYAYLTLNLLAQFGYFATSGGDLRIIPQLAELMGADWRLPRLFSLVAVLSSLVFLSHYLELRTRQPTLLKVLSVCCGLFGLLTVANLVTPARWVTVSAMLVLILATAVVLVAALRGCLQRQRSAFFVLLSWLPMMSLLIVRAGEMIDLWVGPGWLHHALPATFVLSGLIIMIGLSDTLQQLRRERDRVSRKASIDLLTGAMSRQAIEDRLKACVENARIDGLPLSIVFFDVDRFKRINDEYGHVVGDACLRIITQRTRNRLRTYDSLGRWGGDELLVILPDTHLDEGIGVAENLRSAVSCRPLSIEGHRFDASLSLGVAQLADGESAIQLMEQVDIALYASKAGGRNRVTGRVPHGAHPQNA